MKRLTIVLSALIFSFGFVSIVSAQETSIKIQPTLIEERVTPGQTISAAVTVGNLGQQALNLNISVQDISSVAPSGQPVFATEGEITGYELSSWITLKITELELEPGAVREVPFTVTVPKGASPGGHFGAIVFTQEASRPDTVGAGVGYQLTSLISLRLPGEVVEEADIREFSVGKFVYGTTPVEFTTQVDNLGNVLVRPQGFIELYDMWGKKTATVSLNENITAVFPKSSREFKALWEPEGLALGRYQALLSLSYGEDGRKTISRTISFWVLPTKIILPLVGIIVVLISLIVVLIKLYIRSKLRSLPSSSARPIAGQMPPGFSRILTLTIIITLLIVILLGVLFVAL